MFTYDDSRSNHAKPRDGGESKATNHSRDGLAHTLEDLKIIDTLLARSGHAIHAIGLSGGAERLYHLLVWHKSRLKSAYLAGWGNPLWTKGDAKEPGSVFGYDRDMDSADNAFELNLQLADLAVVGISRGVQLAFALNSREGAVTKSGILDELVPVLRQFTTTFELRGDDHDGDGKGRGAVPLCHEYAITDLHDWLRPRVAIGAGVRN